MSDGLLDRRPRKRSVNLALTLEDLYKGATKKLKVRQYRGRGEGGGPEMETTRRNIGGVVYVAWGGVGGGGEGGRACPRATNLRHQGLGLLGG